MNALPVEFLFTFLEKNPIAQEFRNCNITLNQCNKGFSCSCPFHSESGKSCIIYPETHNFYCSGCGCGGDVITFRMLMRNLSYEEAVLELAQESSLSIPSQSPEEALRIQQNRERCYAINRDTANFYYQNLLQGSDRRGLAYFRERKLHPEIIRKYGLGYAPDHWNTLRDYLLHKGYSEDELILANVCRRSDKGNVYDNFRNRVIFPIMDMHRHVIGFGGRVLDDSKPKYLNTSDTPVFDKGRNLFSLQFTGNASTLILAEGYMDVIALHQAGFTNAVATLGTAITPNQARLIAQYANQVIISYDSDSAGQNAAQKAIQHFQNVGLSAKVLHITDAKDPDEFIQAFGADQFRLLLNHAQPVIEFQLNRCRENLDLQTENGKITYLRRIVQILSNIQNAKEQEVYIHQKAQELEIRPEILREQVEYSARRQKFHAVKLNFQNIETQMQKKEYQNSTEFKSEKLILACLMRFPEQYTSISRQLLPEHFQTDFHRKLYQILCQNLPKYEHFIPSLLGNHFNTEEMCRITGIFIDYRDHLNENALADCIQNLLSASRNIPDKSNMSDTEFSTLFSDKRKSTRFT